MQQVAIWHITDAGPAKASAAFIDFEKHLEEWIEKDPALLETGLTIVGRQVQLDAGPLDLLALDPQGVWTVIELKRGAARRDTVAQALDYASCIATLPYDDLARRVNDYLKKASGNPATLEDKLPGPGGIADAQAVPRSVKMFVVGTGRDAGMERLVGYLSSLHKVPISAVSYQVFRIGDGQQILVRELAETETDPSIDQEPKPTLENVSNRAQKVGFGDQFDALVEAGDRHHLYPRVNKYSVMFAPQANKTRALFTIWPDWIKDGKFMAWIGPEVFAKFFGISEEAAQADLRMNGWQRMGPEEVSEFISGLDRLFQRVEKPE